jgi:hypothetical protein
VNIMLKLHTMSIVNRAGLGLLAAATALSLGLAGSSAFAAGGKDPEIPVTPGVAADGKHIKEAVLTGDPSQWGVAAELGTSSHGTGAGGGKVSMND